MKIETLKFMLPSGSQPIPWKLEWEKAIGLDLLMVSPLPAVFLLSNEYLPEFRNYPDLIIDRGIKNKGKELSKYLLGQDTQKIPMIDGSFSSEAQVARSIRTLLGRAQENGEHTPYIIGIDSEILHRLKASLFPEPIKFIPREPFKIDYTTSLNPNEIPTKILVQLRERITDSERHAVNYLGQSDEAELVRLLIAHAAKNSTPVLILGDTGTGKELVAREIHRHSEKSGSKFIAVNCGAIPAELFESELFGHKKGAFTSAIQNKEGLWNKAGTLFLDEIGDLEMRHQVKILRVLEEHAIRPVGGTDSIPVNARIIAATNRDLFSLVQAGKFREDLYYRLRGFLIRTYPLRHHPEDIPFLAEYLWKKIAGNEQKRLPQALLEALKAHDWPGNVREMKLILGNLYTFFGTENLKVDDLKAVFYLEGQNIIIQNVTVAENEVMMHAAECLRHMKRASEVVHATQFALRPLVETDNASPAMVAMVQNNLAFRVGELEMLSSSPSLFYSEPTFFAVWRLIGHMTYFQNYLNDNVKQAQKYWFEELKKEFELVLSAILKGIDEVMKVF